VSQVRRVDCHVHYHASAVGEGFERYLAATPNQTNFRAPAYRDLGVLTETMQASGVDLALLIPNAWLIRALASLGGPMHANTERYNRSLSEDLARLLNEYLAHLWLDTHTQDRHAMALVMAEAGEHTIVLRGDYPVTQPENGVDHALAELDALRLPPATRQKIERDNALTLLGPRTMALLGVEPPATLSEAV
jgi:hypothetical protein